jgi:tetratricopeptide (TPR) repeat protein
MRKTLTLLLLLLCVYGKAQDREVIDSLARKVANSKDEHEKARNLLNLGKAYFQTDYQKSLLFINRSIEISERNHFDTTLAFAYNARGVIQINMGMHREAAASLDSSAKYHGKTGNMQGVAGVYGNMGALYFTIGEYARSLEYQIRCLKIEESLNDRVGLAVTAAGIANVYFVQKDFQKAIEWYEKALFLNRETSNKTDEASALYNLGLSLANLKRYPEAVKKMNESIALADSIGSQEGLANGYYGMGVIYTDLGELDKAQMYCQRSLDIYEASGNIYRAIDVIGWMAEIYFNKKEYAKGIIYYERLLSMSLETGTRQYERDALRGLYRSYAALKDYDKAYDFQSRYIALKDSLFNEEKMKQLTEMQTRFETEKKESENIVLQQQNRLQSYEISRGWYMLLGLASLLILAIVIAVFAILQNRLRARQRTLQLEQKLLRSQMNPHFIFNSLTAIESFIYTNEPKAAGRYLSDFSQLIRLILDNSREEYIPLSKEISTLKYYLDLQRLRFNEQFDYSLEVEPEIDTENIAIPPMLAQPFIENAIEHGIKAMDHNGIIGIRFSLKGKMIHVEVSDNGIGITQSALSEKDQRSHRSLATVITNERLANLNRSKAEKIQLHIEEVLDDDHHVAGTRVAFDIPLREVFGK